MSNVRQRRRVNSLGQLRQSNDQYDEPQRWFLEKLLQQLDPYKYELPSLRGAERRGNPEKRRRHKIVGLNLSGKQLLKLTDGSSRDSTLLVEFF